MRIEDIDIDSPAKYEGKTSITYTNALTGKIPSPATKVIRKYQIVDVSDEVQKLTELLTNPEFSPVMVDNILGERAGYIQDWERLDDRRASRICKKYKYAGLNDEDKLDKLQENMIDDCELKNVSDIIKDTSFNFASPDVAIVLSAFIVYDRIKTDRKGIRK